MFPVVVAVFKDLIDKPSPGCEVCQSVARTQDWNGWGPRQTPRLGEIILGSAPDLRALPRGHGLAVDQKALCRKPDRAGGALQD